MPHLKFGAGPVIESLGSYDNPVTMAGANITLRTDFAELAIKGSYGKSGYCD